jgi:hypothetical protein
MTQEISFHQAFIIGMGSIQLEKEGNRYNNKNCAQPLSLSHNKIQKLQRFTPGLKTLEYG